MSSSDGTPRPRVIAFDLDGTITRGPTVCEAITTHIGRRAEMDGFERERTRDGIARGRERMAEWYSAYSVEDLLEPVRAIPLAPGAHEALALCRAAGVWTALVTITWTFAATHFVEALGFDACVGTVLHKGHIRHFWPEDKAEWLAGFAGERGIAREQTAAVGDSWGDGPMLAWAGRGIYVGRDTPPADGLLHMPDAPLDAAVRALLDD